MLTDEQCDNVLDIISPFIYEIVEIDTEMECAKITFDGDEYSTTSYSVKLNDNNEVILHSLTEPAYNRTHKEEYSHWDEEEDDEYNKKYYVDGKQVTKNEWRESKIDSVVNED